MLQSWMIFFFGLAYLGGLFAVATWGDRPANRRKPGSARPFIYALSLGVYCTSWTYFGSVGIASRSGFDFLPIYIGPILVFALGWPLLQRIAEIAKRQNIASIADFLSARYGKSEALGALVAAVATIGIVPYISIQLKAVSQSLQTMITDPLFPECHYAGHAARRWIVHSGGRHHGFFCHPVWNPPHRYNRASGRDDPRHLG